MVVTVGKTVEGRVIQAYVFGAASSPVTLILGGFHGDEPKSVHVARRLIDHLLDDKRIAVQGRYVVVPLVNADGYEGRKRRNANLVDLNRNFPTQNWLLSKRHSRMFGGLRPSSEPEVCAVIRVIERYDPAQIITIHSIGRNHFCNNYDGPGRSLASRLHRGNGYPVTSSIGYPTPGSLGTWAGVERKIPTVTLELPSHHSPKRCWDDNRAGLLHIGQTD